MTIISLAAGVVLEPLDEDGAIFVSSSGETHVVDVHGFALLQRLVQGPAHRDELATVLAAHAGIPVAELPPEALDRRLAQWLDHGIVVEPDADRR